MLSRFGCRRANHPKCSTKAFVTQAHRDIYLRVTVHFQTRSPGRRQSHHPNVIGKNLSQLVHHLPAQPERRLSTLAMEHIARRELITNRFIKLPITPENAYEEYSYWAVRRP